MYDVDEEKINLKETVTNCAKHACEVNRLGTKEEWVARQMV